MGKRIVSIVLDSETDDKLIDYSGKLNISKSLLIRILVDDSLRKLERELESEMKKRKGGDK